MGYKGDMDRPLTLVTWNVNSIRVRVEHLQRWLYDHQPDVMCLQETKVTDDQFPEAEFTSLGYRTVFTGQKTYNGVAILSRLPIEDVCAGFDCNDAEEQKRLIAATIGGVRVINAYIPNGSSPESDKFEYKLDFISKLHAYFKSRHRPDELLALVGDFNVATEPRDVYDPDALEGHVCFHPKERSAIGTLLEWGLTDQFRTMEEESGFYSWWDYRQGAFRRNMGLRIDHIWVTQPLAQRAAACWIDREERALDKASDHAPVVATYRA